MSDCTKNRIEMAIKEIPAVVQISAPNIKTFDAKIIGTAPYVQLRFSEKAMNSMMDKMKEGSTAKGKKARAARDFDEDFKQALHVSEEGWYGIPAGAFRNAMVDACRLVAYPMTKAKLSIFLAHDGLDQIDGTPMIRIEGKPEKMISAVRNATGVADMRVRARFNPWSAVLRINFDADQFKMSDVANLLMRVGMQVGIGEGRPNSKSSCGMGFGTFSLVME